ncbi:hypothetical protein, partial [Salmonella enterica]|uniref:hypothetical protein n=1 Tax=Salmonella enterica TaxID=28901 RepID=UPI001C2FE1F2
NVNDLVGNRLNFITGAFSGLNTDMYLNAHGITIDASEYTDMQLDRAGVTFDENGANTPIGGVSVLHDPGDQASIQGLWLFTNRGYNTSISYEVDRTDTETVYRPALMVDG